jgi:hypothetical protein
MKKVILAAMVVLGLGTAFVAASLTAQAQSSPQSSKP